MPTGTYINTKEGDSRAAQNPDTGESSGPVEGFQENVLRVFDPPVPDLGEKHLPCRATILTILGCC